MGRTVYRFDEQELAYVPHIAKGRIRARHGAALLGASLIVAALLLNVGISDRVAYWLLSGQNQRQLAKLNGFHQRINQLEEQLMAVNERDQKLYRSLLELEPIDPSVWNAGYGGGQTHSRLQPQTLRNLAKRLHKLRYQAGLQKHAFEQVGVKALAMKRRAECFPVMVPACGVHVSGYGHRCISGHGGSHFHAGVDLAARQGTPVYAAGAGVVRIVGWPESGYGLQVQIDHENGYVTRYAHLSASSVRQGQMVGRGEMIGKIGSTGWSTGPHLHYEVIHQGKALNPAPFMVMPLQRKI